MPDWPQPLLTADFQMFDAAPPDSLSSESLEFLAAGDKPLVFTPGTGNVHASAFFACALVAVTSLGERAIFLTNKMQIPADLPPTVLWQPYVPLSGLLPRTKALVHHGGVGTIAEALRAGVPQLVNVFPALDQFDNGSRVAELGVGLFVPMRRNAIP